jgi:hypothetical protein
MTKSRFRLSWLRSEPELATFPVLLPMSAPIIRAYPREASIAEKCDHVVLPATRLASAEWRPIRADR